MTAPVRCETIDVPVAGGVADAYLARPDDDQRHPGVLFLMDAFGLRPRIAEMTRRIAAHGYVVLAPNLFFRAGRAPVLPFPDMTEDGARAAFMADVRPLMAAVAPERDGAAYLDALAAVADSPFAITGYCMGVRAGLAITAAYPDRVAALAGFHGGGLVTDAPDSPHRLVGALRAEVYLGHADHDAGNTPEQIAALDAALDAAGVPHTSELYAGARHGYTMADTPVYDADADERHHAALVALLERALPA